jgi:hypothetical protein
MMVPLTDPQNPYSKMMIELIADQTPFPMSPLPRRTTEMVDSGMSRRQAAGVVAVIVGLGVIVATGAIRALQS